MSPIKSTAVRTLRTSLISRSPRVVVTTERNVGMAATTRFRPSQPTPSSLDLPPNTIQHKPALLPTHGKIQNTFDSLINNLTTTLTANPSPPLPVLHNLLRTYTSNSLHWSKFAHGNPDKQYTRNLVYEVPGLFNLLLLVWTPGKESPVHDHADSHCLMKVLQGSLTETRFAIPQNPGLDGPLVQTSRKNFESNQVTYMADSLGLHEISNPSQTEYAVSLHLYTPPNAALRGCHIYDIQNGEAKHVMQCPYDSVQGKVPN
ncbi:RmlC-like cupin domain-containing protein [Halenospora varia]|nr:RmlC-like cupin domain-containing protein [Halenospora varia]